jgi:hypothetical protein
LNILWTASWIVRFESFMIFPNNFDAGNTKGIKKQENIVRQTKYINVNDIIAPTFN